MTSTAGAGRSRGVEGRRARSSGARQPSAAGAGRTGRPGGRKLASGRAQELMAAALDLFAERNFASVTIKDIARATGVNTALIYYYFDSKKDLFRATIEDAVNKAFARFEMVEESPDDPAQVIIFWLNNHLHLYDQIHKLVKISLDYKGAPQKDPAIDKAIQRFYDKERTMLSDCIRTGIEKGVFKPVDPDKVAQYISTYLDGAMVRAVILSDFDLPGAVRDLRDTVWELLGYRQET